MVRPFPFMAALLAVPALLAALARPAAAQVVVPATYCPPAPLVSYYAPPVVSYYAAPTVSYYAAPTVSYYAAPAVSYYAAPTVAYYAPQPVYYGPAAVTTTYRYGLFGRRIGTTTYYYP
jgi:hypothetical protein